MDVFLLSNDTQRMICSKCGNSWDENYCPFCGESINKSVGNERQEPNQLNPSEYIPSKKRSNSRLSSLLQTKSNEASDIEKVAIQKAAKRNFIIGGIALILGIAVTVFSFIFYTIGGGFLIITWGAVLYGILSIIKGIKLTGKLLSLIQ